jgi:outer membrane protein TolC
MRLLRFIPVCLLLSVCSQLSIAQDLSVQNLQGLKLETVVELARQNYPAIRQMQAQMEAAEAGVENARASFLPRADLLWQQNVGTRNNLFGLLLPQSTLPSISGPQLDGTSLAGAWGSAGGLLVSWEPFDFGWRKAGVDIARSVTHQARAAKAVTVFEVSVNAADAFLTTLALLQTVRVAQAGVNRSEAFLKIVRALAENQLRPGVDVSRAEAELAAARNQLMQAQQNAELARLQLAEAIGQAGAPLTIDATALPENLPRSPSSFVANLATHPLALAQTAAMDVIRARQHALDRSYFPRFNWQTSVYGRGSSALLTGKFDYGRGFYPNTFNWATGITMTFPVSDIFSLRARRKIEASNLVAEQARYDQIMQTLKTQDARARVLLEAAQKIAANTPIQLKAAQETLQSARVRYEYGLTNIIEVADAQRLLTQAEIEDAVARLTIWRALLAAAKLEGDLSSFLEKTRR